MQEKTNKKSLFDRYVDFNINIAKKPTEKAYWFGVNLRKKINPVIDFLKELPVYINFCLDIVSIGFILAIEIGLLGNPNIFIGFKYIYFLIGIHLIMVCYGFAQERLKYLSNSKNFQSITKYFKK